MADAFPAVTTVRVREALDSVGHIVTNLALAIRGASVLTLLVAVLVLGGALAAGHRHRVYDAVILKTVGATRMRLLSAYALEYLALGLATALFGRRGGLGGRRLNHHQGHEPAFRLAARAPAHGRRRRGRRNGAARTGRHLHRARPEAGLRAPQPVTSAEAGSGLRASDNTPRPADNVPPPLGC